MLLRQAYLKCIAVWSAAGVGEEGVDPLAAVHEAGKVAKAVFVACGLLLALQSETQS